MNEEEMLASITSDTRLDDAFLRSMYCKGMDNSDFPEQVIAALEAAGHSKAREQYQAWVQQYEAEYKETLKQIAHWYAKETEKFYERWVRESRRQQKTEMMDNLHQLSDRKLLNLLRSLKEGSL